MIKYLNLVIMVLGFLPLLAAEARTLAEARILAREVNKPLLIDFWSDN